MNENTYRNLALLVLLLLTACGTLEIGVEQSASPEGELAATAAALATENAQLSAQATQLAEVPLASLPLSLTTSVSSTSTGPVEPEIVLVPVDAPTLEETIVITGTVAALDFPAGWAYILPDAESRFADEQGQVRALVSEWTRMVTADGAVFAREDLSKGARLEVLATLQGEDLAAQQVVVLSPGVPRPEDNPAYTDVAGLVEPLPEPPPAGEGIIKLFEAASVYPIVDPGATITLQWAFEGEFGAICERITPRPLSDTCYQDLPASGSLEVSVPAEARGAIGYFLYAHAGEQVGEALVILPLSVERGCAYQWFFGSAEYEHKPLLECPTGEPVPIRPQAQLFEKGLMLRLEGVGSEGAWLVALLSEEQGFPLVFEPVLDPWTAGMAETDPVLTPPEGLLQPSRGLGMLWRGEIEHRTMADVLTLDGVGVLGWATGNVFEYDTFYQCLESTHGRAMSCFMGGPEGSVLPMPVTP